MGEVYRAKDTRLDRSVAIKVLSADLSSNPDLRQRFEREARAVSSLNHPHICTLHDVGRQDGVDYLVMEYLEGETLADRLGRGPLPPRQALRVGAEIADALDKAHRQGIVHRDLKPGNVMLGKSGAKLLDFGLAKLAAPAATPALSPLSAFPTQLKPLTGGGTVIGTFQYMSPEQIEGKEADARSDIFALGSVLYEMTTGRKAFEGKTQASLIAAILSSEPPPISSLQPLAPPALDHLVRACLAKDLEDRWQTAHDVMTELQWIAEAGSQPGAVPAGTERRVPKRLAWGLAGLAVLVAGGLGFRAARGAGGAASISGHPPMRVALTFPPEAPLKAVNRVDLALSPDGTRLVYVGGDKQKTQLYVRPLDQFESKPIPGTELAGLQEGNPFFSPDGRSVGFFADGKLKKVALEGGSPVVLCDAPTGRGGSWGDNDQIVFAPALTSGLSRISAAGGTPKVLTRPDPKKGETSHRWPQVLPGGATALFTIGRAGSFDDAWIGAVALETGQVKVLVEGGFFPRFLPTGHIVFARSSRLMAAAFDPATLAVGGTPVPLVDSVETNRNGAGAAEFVFSRDGTLLYLPAELPDRSLVFVDRKGTEEPLPTPVRAYTGLSLSPGGDRVALMVDDGSNQDIWVHDVAAGTLTRLTFGGSNEGILWTPDGKRITYSAVQPGGLQSLVSLPADGSSKPEPLDTGRTGWQWPQSWSPDGRTLMFNATQPETDYDIWLVSLDGQSPPRPFVQTPFDERDAVFSPDGHWIAYQSNLTGRAEIYVQPFPGPGGRRQVSTAGGVDPIWSPSGRELFYREGEDAARIMAVDVEAKEALRTTKPRMLFEGRYFSGADTGDYAISPDGRRFLMIKLSERDATLRHVNVVLGWFDEVRRRVP